MSDATPLDYQELRNISPKAARQAILQILKANEGKVSQTARMLGITRRTVYKAMSKKKALSEHTIRNIVRRNKDSIKNKKHKPHKKGPRPFVDWYSAKPFEVVQVDLKYVVDQKALSLAQIDHIYAHKLPIYQWSAMDVNTRFKLIAYSDQKSWTNGLTWFLWVISWLRSHGVSNQIIFTVDHGEEFGGKSWFKITELKKSLMLGNYPELLRANNLFVC